MEIKPHSLFISDLHLCDSRPNITQALIVFLQETAIKAQALYILGDLFEYWAGDDAIEAGHQQTVIAALKRLNRQGVALFFMHGNRDFLLSDGFAQATLGNILPDPTLLHLYNNSVLLSHGDIFCTDDIAYQQFRTQVRAPAWQNQFLNQSLDARIAYIEQIRLKSEQEKSLKSMQIMDVNQQAVEAMLREYHYPPLLIHGHTHRPNKHIIKIDNHTCERWVLGDWYEQGSYLKLDESGCQSQSL
ncbi:MAG: UDP-2,3-diacylglucosamine diphosphatase [Methylotenera sp.]|nr:UDP-2,3-diacylglucosamine diphosphatase [Methylotenera sp.]PPD17888.1 MAG: UDP-2,3-diacylglucosamine diphosphatase [Methylotenera sp.]